MNEASMEIGGERKESIFDDMSRGFREAVRGLGLSRKAQADALDLFAQGRRASGTDPRVAQIGEQALELGKQMVDLQAQRRKTGPSKPGALKEELYQLKTTLEKTCGKLVDALDPHLSAIPSKRTMAKAVVGLAEAIREEGQSDQMQTSSLGERIKTRVQKAFAGTTAGGNRPRLGPSLGGAAMAVVLLLGLSACGGEGKAVEKPAAVAPAPGGDSGEKTFLQKVQEELDKTLPGVGKHTKVTTKYLSDPKASQAKISDRQKADHYLVQYQERRIRTSPWAVEKSDIMILAVSYGPGWWARVPPFKQSFELLAGRNFPDPEWQSFADDPQKAIALIKELYAAGKIDEKAYNFYLLSPEEMKAEANEKFPGLLSTK